MTQWEFRTDRSLTFTKIPKDQATQQVERATEDSGERKSIVDLLSMPNADEIEFEPPRLGGDEFPEPADFS